MAEGTRAQDWREDHEARIQALERAIEALENSFLVQRMEEEEEGSNRTRGFVYFCLTEDERFVKIGYSTKPQIHSKVDNAVALKRYGCGIRLLGLLPGDSRTENWTQLQFREARDHGKWFEFTNGMRDFLDSIELLPPDYNPHRSLLSVLKRQEAENEAAAAAVGQEERRASETGDTLVYGKWELWSQMCFRQRVPDDSIHDG